MFSLEAQQKKSQLIVLKHFKTQNVRLPVYKDGVVFAAFRSFDIDYNGFLEWNEYQQCLTKLKELELTTEEVITLNLLADLDGDGRIDYQEFMKHFEDIVFMIKQHNALQVFYDELPERKNRA
jgi:hypothetical protein